MIRIALADDHRLLRQGLRALLEAEKDFRVVGEAADGLEAVEMVRKHQPDVLLLDLSMPGLSGVEVARRTVQLAPRTKVVILSMYATRAYVAQALRNGAAGYVTKDESAEHLVQAVRTVNNGQRFLSPSLSEEAIDDYVRRLEKADVDPYRSLTPREREVLHLASEGLTSAAVAQRLSISPRTAEVHRANMMRKLGLRSQTDLVRYAIGREILHDERPLSGEGQGHKI